MPDIPNVTTDVTIFAPDGGNGMEVNSDNEGLVHDQDLLDAIAQPTADNTPDLWQYITNQQQGFSVTTPLITIAGQAENDFILFRNPTGSGKKIKIHDIDYTYNKGSGESIIKIYNSPVITNVGTPVTINKLYSGGLISPVSLIYQLPTISDRGVFVRAFGQSAVTTYSFEYHLGKILTAGFDFLITVQPAANNTDHSVYVDWGEVI